MRQVDFIPEHVASRIVAIQERLSLNHTVMLPCDREKLQTEQTQLWDTYFPGVAYEEIAARVPSFLIAA